jgi:hypothetical protein
VTERCCFNCWCYVMSNVMERCSCVINCQSLELSSCGLFQGIVPEISRTHGGKHDEDLQSGYAATLPRFEPTTTRTRLETCFSLKKRSEKSAGRKIIFWSSKRPQVSHVLSAGQRSGSWRSCDIIMLSVWTPASAPHPSYNSFFLSPPWAILQRQVLLRIILAKILFQRQW